MIKPVGSPSFHQQGPNPNLQQNIDLAYKEAKRGQPGALGSTLDAIQVQVDKEPKALAQVEKLIKMVSSGPVTDYSPVEKGLQELAKILGLTPPH